MTTKQKNNSIIIILVAALIITGVFYSKLKKDPDVSIVETEITPQVDNSIIVPEENSNDAETLNNPASVNNKEEEKKFNLALSKGTKEFLAKNYVQAINYYKEALTYKDAHEAYIRLFTVYSSQNNIEEARLSLEKAIKLNPSYTDYWITKLFFLDEKTPSSFVDLKAVYTEALNKVDPRTKINLVTVFARIAEHNNEKSEAIKLWEYAIELYPQNKELYQKEIDALK